MKNYEDLEDLEDFFAVGQSHQTTPDEIYDEKVKKSNREKFLETLEKEVNQENKSYYEGNKGLVVAVLITSYFTNVLSLLSFSTLILWVTGLITSSIWIALPLGFIALVLLEQFKRKSSNIVFKDWLFRPILEPKKKRINGKWLAFSLTIAFVSIFGSSLGFYFGVLDFSPIPNEIKTTEDIEWLETEKSKYETANKKLESMVNSDGVMFLTYKKPLKANAKKIIEISDRLIALRELKTGENTTTLLEHQTKVANVAIGMAILGFVIELIFELCIYWLWRFKLNCYIEQRMLEEKKRKEEAQKLRFLKNDTPPNIEENNNPKPMYTHVHEKKRTIKHIKPDGKSAYYTATQVKNRIADYKGRVKEAKEAYKKALKEGDDGKIISSFESVNTNTEKLGYWQGRVLEFNNVAA